MEKKLVLCIGCAGAGYTLSPITFIQAPCASCGGLGLTLPEPEHEVILDLEPEKRRPSWDRIYMDHAKSVARRSTCDRLQVGCVIASLDNQRSLAVGYNGGPKGLYNGCLSTEPGKCGHLHAEINALIKLNYHDAAEKKAYVTTSPCRDCCVALINAGVVELIYERAYRDISPLELLRQARITVRQFTEEEQ